MLVHVRYPPQFASRCMLSKTEHILVVDNSWTSREKMGVYMEPGIGELLHAWEEGVWTYD
jgi:hypothetical protein